MKKNGKVGEKMKKKKKKGIDGHFCLTKEFYDQTNN